MLVEGFKGSSGIKKSNDDFSQDELYRQIGQLKVELEWLKKKSGLGG